jgi:DNA-binding winged helix-turn-helix (wHTH) protein
VNDTAHILRFAGYGLDPSRRSLERGGRPLALRPQAMEVLCYLARNPGRPVSKEELFHEVWPGISVTDDSLVQCIGDIRDVLEDRDHRIVKTIPRLGYLFAATISRDQAKYPALAPNVLAAHLAPPFHDHPSIAILPFVDADGDPDGLADGICEDIITGSSGPNVTTAA